MSSYINCGPFSTRKKAVNHDSVLIIKEVTEGRERLKLSKDLIVKVTKKGKMYFFESDELGIYAFGDDYKSAKQDFFENFFVYKREFVDADESELAYNGKRIKDRFIEYIYG